MAEGIPRVALYLQDKHPVREELEIVRYAESRGFEAVWQADTRLARDCVSMMGAFAAVTQTLKIGSGVLPIWPRNAAVTASTFSTLWELAPNRIICGLGAWWEPITSSVGIRRHRPLRAMREHVEVLRRLFAMETVTYEGEFVQLKDVKLDLVHGDTGPRDIPIFIGATGDQMLELSGEIADGVVLNYVVSPGYIKHACELVARGGARAGRTLDDIDRPELLVCSMDRDRGKALQPARELVAYYLAAEPHLMQASGASEDLLASIRQVTEWPLTAAVLARVAKLVPDDIVTNVTASGTPDECLAKVREYVAAGTTCPILYPLGDDVRLMIDVFATR